MENNQQAEPEQGSMQITWEDCCSLASGASEDISLCVKVEPNDRSVIAKSGWLYLIADGSGITGIEAGQYVLERVVAEYYRQDNVAPGERLRVILRSIGAQLYSQAKKENIRFSPVDLTAAIIFEGQITVANAGGNRAYLIHDGQVQLITHDPTRLNEMLRKGSFTVEDAQNTTRPRKLYQRLGEQPESEVDIIEDIPMISGDMLLLCNNYLAQRIDEEDPLSFQTWTDPGEICTALTSDWDFSDPEKNIILLSLKFEMEVAQTQELYEEYRPIPAPPAQTHYRPGPVYAHAPIRGMRSKSRFSAWFYFIIFMCIVGAGLLGWLFLSNLGIGRLNSPSATATSVLAAEIQTQAAVSQMTTAAPEGAGSQKTATNAPSPVPTIAASETPKSTKEGSVCVWEVEKGNSLYSTIRKFDLAYKDDEAYYFLENCDLVKETCTGEKKEIVSHASINAGWFVIIPVADQDACTAGKGAWVIVE